MRLALIQTEQHAVDVMDNRQGQHPLSGDLPPGYTAVFICKEENA